MWNIENDITLNWFERTARKLKKEPKRLHDFEGRCGGCKGYRDLIIEVIDKHNVHLSVDVCPEHPDECRILWPVRDDVRRKE